MRSRGLYKITLKRTQQPSVHKPGQQYQYTFNNRSAGRSQASGKGYINHNIVTK